MRSFATISTKSAPAVVVWRSQTHLVAVMNKTFTKRGLCLRGT